MNRFKNKNGFTLVECVVAMAVLAIMSLLLMMILNVTIAARNNNKTLEKELDEQVAKIVQAPTTADPIAQEIEFVQGGAVLEAIPKNGDDHIKAEKVYNDGHQNEIDALKYDFKNYDKFDQISKGNGATPDPGDNSSKVYGSSDTSKVQISEQSVVNNTDPPQTKTITLRISFTVTAFNANVDTVKSIKVALPATATDIKVLASSNAKTLLITENVVRIEPTAKTTVYADVSFVLTDDEYTNDYKNVKNFYEGTGTGSPADLNKNADGEFKP